MQSPRRSGVLWVEGDVIRTPLVSAGLRLERQSPLLCRLVAGSCMPINVSTWTFGFASTLVPNSKTLINVTAVQSCTALYSGECLLASNKSVKPDGSRLKHLPPAHVLISLAFPACGPSLTPSLSGLVQMSRCPPPLDHQRKSTKKTLHPHFVCLPPDSGKPPKTNHLTTTTRAVAPCKFHHLWPSSKS